MKEFMGNAKTKYNANKITAIARVTILEFINKRCPKIRIDFLLKIIDVIKDEKYLGEEHLIKTLVNVN